MDRKTEWYIQDEVYVERFIVKELSNFSVSTNKLYFDSFEKYLIFRKSYET